MNVLQSGLMLGLLMGLTACKGGREAQAADACHADVSNRLTGKVFNLSKDEFRKSAVAEGEDMVAMKATVVFDPGLPNESKQVVDCKVQFDTKGNAAPAVVHVQFTW